MWRFTVSPGESVIELEALLRAVIGDVLSRELGDGWHQRLSSTTRRVLESNHERVKRARDDAPDDPWQIAGLAEIQQVILSLLGGSPPEGFDPKILGPLWTSPEECRVDLERIRAARVDEAHPGASQPQGDAERAVVEALIRRIRIGAEQIRRTHLHEDDEWWPFIQQVSAPNVEGWGYVRGSEHRHEARLVEGDEVEFHVVAVHPTGPQEDLEYALLIAPPGGGLGQPSWQQSNVLIGTASPQGRGTVFLVVIRNRHGASRKTGWDDEVAFSAVVVPSQARS